MLEIKALRAAYGRVPVLHGINMKVEQGEFVGVLGHNGMGKTTLLRAVMGFVAITGGEVLFQGTPIHRLPAFKRSRLGVSLVPQGRDIFPNLTALENLTVGAIGKGQDAERIEEVLDFFPRLRTILDRRGAALSGGEQQLLALARALCNSPTLVLLDEPTEGIQPSIIQEISEVLKALREKHQLTVVLVEQNIDFIAGLADRVLTIQKGEITGQVQAHQLSDSELMGDFTGFAANANA